MSKETELFDDALVQIGKFIHAVQYRRGVFSGEKLVLHSEEWMEHWDYCNETARCLQNFREMWEQYCLHLQFLSGFPPKTPRKRKAAKRKTTK